MTIYNINLGIGWASSGVEYAQAYRAQILRSLGMPAKFIFTNMFQSENLEHFTKNIGFEDSEIDAYFQKLNIDTPKYLKVLIIEIILEFLLIIAIIRRNKIKQINHKRINRY